MGAPRAILRTSWAKISGQTRVAKFGGVWGTPRLFGGYLEGLGRSKQSDTPWVGGFSFTKRGIRLRKA